MRSITYPGKKHTEYKTSTCVHFASNYHPKNLTIFILLVMLTCFSNVFPAAAAAIGYIDSMNGGELSGWALDQSAPSVTLNVAIYRDGPQGTGRLAGYFQTNIARADVNTRYSTTGDHGFAWQIPSTNLSTLHIWFVYGIGANGGATLLYNGPAVYPPISATETGPPEPVYTYQTQACSQFDIPDHPARAFRTADGNVNLIASHIDVRRAVGPTLNSVVHQCRVIHTTVGDPNFADFNYYQWYQGPYTLDGTTIYVLVHNEWYGELVDPACNGSQIDSWVSAVTTAVSHNGGASFTEPLDYIVRNPSTPWSNSFPCSNASPTRYGDLGGSNIIAKNGYYYKFFYYETEPSVVPAGAWQCLMRTNNLASASSWQIWNGAGWVGDKTAPCAALPVLQNARSVTFNTYLHAYVAIQWFGSRGFFISVSWDLLNWSAPISISTPELDTSSTPYPSLLDPNDTTLNFEVTGPTSYLYYTQLHNGGNGDLDRIPISLSVDLGAASNRAAKNGRPLARLGRDRR